MDTPSVDPALIDRYVAGECTPYEVDCVLQWVGTDPDRQELIKRAQIVWGAARRLPGEWNVDQAWERARPALRASGAIPSHAIVQRPGPLGWRARRGPLIAAAACVTIAVLGVALRQVASRHGSAGSVESITTGPRQRATMQLRDGSRVVLAPNSRLAESAAFGVGTREIDLVGAAYFDVVHDPSRPFVVVTHDLRIRDVGTRFAVDAYTSPAATSDALPLRTESRIAVTAGSVEIEALHVSAQSRTDSPSAVGPSRIVVSAGHVVGVDARGNITVHRAANIDQYVSWTTNDLTFDDVPVGEAIPRLEDWYGVRIMLTDPTLACRHITATFHDQTLNQVLDELGLVLHVHAVSSSGGVTLEPSDARAPRHEQPTPGAASPGECAGHGNGG